MRAEDKELEGPDLEREEETRQETAHEEEELPAIGGEAIRDAEHTHRSTLFDALRLVLAGEHVVVSLLYLPKRESQALEALQAAVTGQDSVGEFVFAEDRAALLEQALAVLQQNLTHGEPEQLAELHAKFGELTERIGELRHRLVNLEDAQDDLFDEKRQWAEMDGAAEGDNGDKGDGDKGSGAPDRPDEPRSSTLYGEAPPEPPPPPSTLEGPDRPDEPPPPSALYGDAPPEPPPPPSTLEGPDRPDEPAPPSALYGDALPEEPAPPSTLGAEPDPDPRPWWRRPFG